MTMITPSYLGETIEYSSLHACRSTLEDPTLDAPGVVRNLLLVGAAAAVALASRLLGVWNGHSVLAPVFYALMSAGVGCSISGIAMIWYSRIGKLAARERLFDSLKLKGDETILDVGCGRGLWLLGAARRLPHGKAIGIDIWNTQDLSGNAMARTQENARAEGCADRVELKTADARKLPFDDATFELVVSSMALHNIHDKPGRDQAIAEINRVLKPGGRVVLFDIRHTSQYAKSLEKLGTNARVDRSLLSMFIAGWTFGSLLPGRVTAQKLTGAILVAS